MILERTPRLLRFHRLVIVMTLACLAIGCGGGATDGPTTPARASVLLVTLDTTRADRVGCYGYGPAATPTIDGLAQKGVKFNQACAQTPTTLPSHTSILTGTYAPFHGARGNGSYRVDEGNETLAEILKEEGYQTAAIIAAFVLDSRYGLDQGFDTYDDDTAEMEQSQEFTDPSRIAPQVNRAALDAVSKLDRDRPFFLWVHYFDPHAPYLAAREFASKYPQDYSGRYDAEIAMTDHYLGELLKALREDGRMKNTITVVVGDHGEGFPGPHKEMTHGIFLYQDTLHVPLVFHAPGTIDEGVGIDSLARQIDIAPTLLDLLGIEGGEQFQGSSLRQHLESTPTRGDAEPVVSYADTILPWDAQGWSPLFSVRDTEWKLILAPRPELYDLTTDPEQVDNIYREDHEQVARLRPILDRIRDDVNPLVDVVGQPVNAKQLQRLIDIGYQISGVEVIPDDLSDKKDPKDLIDTQEPLEYARIAFAEGNGAKGVALANKVLEMDPENLEANQRLAGWHKQQGEFDLALEHAGVILKVREKWGAIHGLRGEIFMTRAQKHWQSGDKDAASADFKLAIEALERAFELNSFEPAHPGRIATICSDFLDDKKKAEEYFKKALAIDPEEPRTSWAYGKMLFEQRRMQEARPLLETASRFEKFQPNMRLAILMGLAQCCGALNDAYAAVAAVDRLIVEFPEHEMQPDWRNLRAQIVQRMEDAGMKPPPPPPTPGAASGGEPK